MELRIFMEAFKGISVYLSSYFKVCESIYGYLRISEGI